MLTGATRYDLVVGRQGVLAEASTDAGTLRTETRNYWQGVCAGLFTKYPDAAFVIVSRRPITKWGLGTNKPSRDGQLSPVLYYRSNWKRWGGAKNRQIPRVVPRGQPARLGKRGPAGRRR
jgi:hypothetical protein